jgi:phosphatidate cytidylyltransferase
VQQEAPIKLVELVLMSTVSGFLIGGLGLCYASRNVPSSTRSKRWLKFITYFCVIHSVLLSAFFGSAFLSLFFFAVLAFGGWELRCARIIAPQKHHLRWLAINVVYVLLSVGVLSFVFHSPAETVIFVYLIVATFDGFSQVTGQLFGKHPLAARISPGKTIEGTFGGLLLATIIAMSLRSLLDLTILQSLEACALIVIFSLMGDLAASWIKRLSGLKDFGAVLPGHGGFLDRFDSFLFAATACYAFLSLR